MVNKRQEEYVICIKDNHHRIKLMTELKTHYLTLNFGTIAELRSAVREIYPEADNFKDKLNKNINTLKQLNSRQNQALCKGQTYAIVNLPTTTNSKGACSVCDELCINLTGFGISALLENLKWCKKILRTFQPIESDMDPRLSKLLLSPRGVSNEVVYICERCQKELENESDLPPSFSLANGFWCGELPSEFSDMSPIEINSVQLTLSFTCIHLIRNVHYELKGHFVTYMSDPGAIVKILPCVDKISVVLCGPFTPKKKIEAKKKFSLRAEKCKNLLKFFKQNNPHYREIEIQEIDEKSSVLHLEDVDLPPNDELTCPIDLAPPALGSFFRLSPKPQYYSSNVISILFPKQFPYGTGCPATPRKKPISFERCLEHYLKSSNKHMHEPVFVLHL